MLETVRHNSNLDTLEEIVMILWGNERLPKSPPILSVFFPIGFIPSLQQSELFETNIVIALTRNSLGSKSSRLCLLLALVFSGVYCREIGHNSLLLLFERNSRIGGSKT